jgi:hypothetical protein
VCQSCAQADTSQAPSSELSGGRGASHQDGDQVGWIHGSARRTSISTPCHYHDHHHHAQRLSSCPFSFHGVPGRSLHWGSLLFLSDASRQSFGLPPSLGYFFFFLNKLPVPSVNSHPLVFRSNCLRTLSDTGNFAICLTSWHRATDPTSWGLNVTVPQHLREEIVSAVRTFRLEV